MAQTAGKTQIVDVGVVGIPVADQDRALAFYAGTLGFEVRVDAPMPNGGRWIMVAPPGASTALALVAAREGIPAGVETGIRLASKDAAADHDTMVAAGVDADEVLNWPGVPAMFAFRDPDGNGLEVVEFA